MAENISNSTNATTILPLNITNTILGNPILVEKIQVIGQRLLDISNGLIKEEGSFIGNGTAKGIKYTDIGSSVVTRNPDGAEHILGQKVITMVTERTTANIQAIGHVTADGKLIDSGTMFFNTASPPDGKLAFLNNKVIVFKEVIDDTGNGMVAGWEWK
jgi:hypothetical protein